ncbi:MAG: hypothetical protein HY684_04555 [Chloroflexi bacterium]|nr:hypothetical protein [Chloroflexota bacterium]
MPRQIVLDSVQQGGINVFKDAAGVLKVQANYRVMAAGEVVRNESKDVTSLLSSAQLRALSASFDDVFAAVCTAELGT